jgi:aryl-alcohol dehydrogenase-like predicted oxidoreductase
MPAPASSTSRKTAAKLGLGTAQFGSDYGVSNVRGRIGRPEASAILQTAALGGVELIDTSAEYGEAEAMLGALLPRVSPFRMMTKTIPLSQGVAAVETRARGSLRKLGIEQAQAILVDRPSDLLGPYGSTLWNKLRALKDEGLFRQIGIACEAGDDPVGLARRFKPDLMQVSVSLLDQRLAVDGRLAVLAAQGIELHLRSVFLQGLLFLPGHGLPPGLAEAGPGLSRIRRMLAEAGADPLQAALAFALGRAEASTVIVGVTSAAELRAILAAAAAPAPQLDWHSFALDHPVALDPRLWAAA